ncbi:MAG: HlyD family efflux transporter periplasmic adaptor subunit [Chitinophagaceae bacterium]
MRKIILGSTMAGLLFFTACKDASIKMDASGSFEAEETIVSSELSGKIISLKVEEGDLLAKDSIIGTIDARNLALQKEQVEASINTLGQKTADPGPSIQLLQNQLAVQQSQLNNLLQERSRIENLLKADAATSKQLDDMNAQVETTTKMMNVTKQQINVQKNNIATQNRSILSEADPLRKRAAQLQDMEQRAAIVNPVTGTVTTKYAEEGEVTAAAKPLYKIADLTYLQLRAYVSGTQLSQIKIGQLVKVFIDDGEKKYKEYAGNIIWIADKAEFTPKTIQTKEERVNLVYAIKVKVKNDGFLKIGMYGEAKF